jgi:hypothetical protein
VASFFTVLVMAVAGPVWGQQPATQGAPPTIRITKGSPLAVTIPPDKTTYQIELSGNPVHDVVFGGSGAPAPEYTLTTSSTTAPKDNGTMTDPQSQIFRLNFGRASVGTHTYTITARNTAGEATANFTVTVVWQGPAQLAPPPASTGAIENPTATNSVSANPVLRPKSRRVSLRMAGSRPQYANRSARLNLRLPEFLSRLLGGGWPVGGRSVITGGAGGGETAAAGPTSATTPPTDPSAPLSQGN